VSSFWNYCLHRFKNSLVLFSCKLAQRYSVCLQEKGRAMSECCWPAVQNWIFTQRERAGHNLIPPSLYWRVVFSRFQILQKATISFVIYVRLSLRPSTCYNSAPTGRIFMKFCIWVFFEKPVKKTQVSLQSGKNNEYFTWRSIHFFDHISLSSSQNEKCLRQNF